ASGFNLAASAVRDGRRLIGVIMGGHSARGRDQQMGSLLDQGFAHLAATRPAQPQTAPVVAAATPAASSSALPAAAAVAATAPAAAGDTAAAAPRSGFIGNVASATLRHLSPVGKAEAAPLAREAPAAGEDW